MSGLLLLFGYGCAPSISIVLAGSCLACHALDRAGLVQPPFIIGLGILLRLETENLPSDFFKSGAVVQTSLALPPRVFRWGFLILRRPPPFWAAPCTCRPTTTRWPTAPRVCCTWLAQHQWYWVHTEFARLNTRTAGFEWVTAPIILFTGTDHFLFLVNIVCFSCCCPDGIFSLS